LSIEFTRQQYLQVWRDERYISQHLSLLECAESASNDATQHGEGEYEIRVGTEVYYLVSIRHLTQRQLTNLIVAPNASPPINNPPVWDAQPSTVSTFIQGSASSVDFDDISSDPDMDPITHSLNTGVASLPTGVTWTPATGVLSYDGAGVAAVTTGHIATLDDGSDTTDSNSFSISIIDQYPQLMNNWGGDVITSIGRFWDTSSEMYLFARTVNSPTVQINNLTMQSNRNSRGQEWLDLAADNPLFFGLFHFKPTLGSAAYERKDFIFESLQYKYLNTNHRQDVLGHRDAGDWATVLEGIKTSTSGFAQSQVVVNITDLGYRIWLANAYTDFLVGSDVASSPDFPATGFDMSEFGGIFNDRTTFQEMASSAKLERSQRNGTIVSVDSTRAGTNHLKSVTLSGGTLAASVIDEDIFFFPPSGTTGFIGYSIQSIASDQATLKNLESTAALSQDTVPGAGWRYSIADSSQQQNAIDWDKDGTAESQVAGADIWIPDLADLFDRVNTQVTAQTGHGAGRGWNGINKSYTHKEAVGFTTPHPMTGLQDYPTAEGYSGHWRWDADFPTHKYEVQGYTAVKHLRALSFASTFVDSTPNTFMSDKPRGAYIEMEVWGSSSHYTNGTSLDAHLMRYHLAALLSVPNLRFAAQAKVSQAGVPWAIPECFLDIDTNYSAPALLGTYNEDDGGTPGPDGPLHEYIEGTAEAGTKIRIYRIGDVMVILNMDKPGDYGAEYIPPGHASAYTPRAVQDEIAPADWDALVTAGVLTASERLRRFDFSTYVNSRVTSWLRAKAPTVWGSSAPGGPYSYGPEQTTPFDGDAFNTLATAGWKVDDTGVNSGATYDMEVTQQQAPLTALFLEIYVP
jgi:hypothetical protein